MKEKTSLCEKILTFMCFAILCAVCLSSVFIAKGENTVQGKVIRLHVYGDSDRVADTELKLLVKDEAEKVLSGLIADCETYAEAEKIVKSSGEVLTNAAKKALCDNNASSDVSVDIGEMEYPVRRYESLTFPAGTYLSVRVKIGSGRGHNWWCVVFPKLCESGQSDDRTVLTSGGLTNDEVSRLMYTDEKSSYDGQKVKVKFAFSEAIKNIGKKIKW